MKPQTKNDALTYMLLEQTKAATEKARVMVEHGSKEKQRDEFVDYELFSIVKLCSHKTKQNTREHVVNLIDSLLCMPDFEHNKKLLELHDHLSSM